MSESLITFESKEVTGYGIAPRPSANGIAPKAPRLEISNQVPINNAEWPEISTPKNPKKNKNKKKPSPKTGKEKKEKLSSVVKTSNSFDVLEKVTKKDERTERWKHIVGERPSNYSPEGECKSKKCNTCVNAGSGKRTCSKRNCSVGDWMRKGKKGKNCMKGQMRFKSCWYNPVDIPMCHYCQSILKPEEQEEEHKGEHLGSKDLATTPSYLDALTAEPIDEEDVELIEALEVSAVLHMSMDEPQNMSSPPRRVHFEEEEKKKVLEEVVEEATNKSSRISSLRKLISIFDESSDEENEVADEIEQVIDNFVSDEPEDEDTWPQEKAMILKLEKMLISKKEKGIIKGYENKALEYLNDTITTKESKTSGFVKVDCVITCLVAVGYLRNSFESFPRTCYTWMNLNVYLDRIKPEFKYMLLSGLAGSIDKEVQTYEYVYLYDVISVIELWGEGSIHLPNIVKIITERAKFEMENREKNQTELDRLSGKNYTMNGVVTPAGAVPDVSFSLSQAVQQDIAAEEQKERETKRYHAKLALQSIEEHKKEVRIEHLRLFREFIRKTGYSLKDPELKAIYLDYCSQTLDNPCFKQSCMYHMENCSFCIGTKECPDCGGSRCCDLCGGFGKCECMRDMEGGTFLGVENYKCIQYLDDETPYCHNSDSKDDLCVGCRGSGRCCTCKCDEIVCLTKTRILDGIITTLTSEDTVYPNTREYGKNSKSTPMQHMQSNIYHLCKKVLCDYRNFVNDGKRSKGNSGTSFNHDTFIGQLVEFITGRNDTSAYGILIEAGKKYMDLSGCMSGGKRCPKLGLFALMDYLTRGSRDNLVGILKFGATSKDRMEGNLLIFMAQKLAMGGFGTPGNYCLDAPPQPISTIYHHPAFPGRPLDAPETLRIIWSIMLKYAEEINREHGGDQCWGSYNSWSKKDDVDSWIAPTWEDKVNTCIEAIWNNIPEGIAEEVPDNFDEIVKKNIWKFVARYFFPNKRGTLFLSGPESEFLSLTSTDIVDLVGIRYKKNDVSLKKFRKHMIKCLCPMMKIFPKREHENNAMIERYIKSALKVIFPSDFRREIAERDCTILLISLFKGNFALGNTANLIQDWNKKNFHPNPQPLIKLTAVLAREHVRVNGGSQVRTSYLTQFEGSEDIRRNMERGMYDRNNCQRIVRGRKTNVSLMSIAQGKLEILKEFLSHPVVSRNRSYIGKYCDIISIFIDKHFGLEVSDDEFNMIEGFFRNITTDQSFIVPIYYLELITWVMRKCNTAHRSAEDKRVVFLVCESDRDKSGIPEFFQWLCNKLVTGNKFPGTKHVSIETASFNDDVNEVLPRSPVRDTTLIIPNGTETLGMILAMEGRVSSFAAIGECRPGIGDTVYYATMQEKTSRKRLNVLRGFEGSLKPYTMFLQWLYEKGGSVSRIPSQAVHIHETGVRQKVYGSIMLFCCFGKYPYIGMSISASPRDIPHSSLYGNDIIITEGDQGMWLI